jgi:hypothetical protein
VKVPKLWPNSTIVCLATGPSLTPEDVNYCRGKAHVIAISDAYKLAPWADVLYSCDAKWWTWAHDHKRHPRFAEFQGLKYALTAHSARFPGVQVLKNTGKDGLERHPAGLRTGRNSGFQAINLAVHLGASRIVLLGYDMGGKHFFGNHPDGSAPPFADCIKRFTTLVAPLAELGIEVINCTRKTALTAFPQRSLMSLWQ